MKEHLKDMISEGCLRFKKPSQIQKYVYNKFGYLISKETISEALIEQSGIKKSKPSLWLKYRLAHIQDSSRVNVVELDLSDEDFLEDAVADESRRIFVSVGDTTVELNSQSIPVEMLSVLQSAGLEL